MEAIPNRGANHREGPFLPDRGASKKNHEDTFFS